MLNINKYEIKLKLNKQLLYRQIQNQVQIELKFIKIYIKINLVNILIKSFELLIKISIYFDKKLDRNFYLYI